MVEDVDEVEIIKARAKESQKGRTKGRKAVEAKARAKKVAAEKWHTLLRVWPLGEGLLHMVNHVKQEPFVPNATAS